MHAIFGIRLGALAAALTVCGCFTIVDVDKFHVLASQGHDGSAGKNPPGEYTSLKLTFLGMTPHVTQLFEYRVIDGNNFIQSRGVVNPLGGADVTINVPFAVPKVNGPFHLDFYADVNNSGGYDGIGAVLTQDHAWRIDPLDDYPSGFVQHVDGLYQVTFTHNTSFTHIEDYPNGTPNAPGDTGVGAVIHIDNAVDLAGDLIQVRIVDTGANHTVGLFRVPKITDASFNMTIPGIVEAGVEYDTLVYVDANANGQYDNPATSAGDLGWSHIATADATGLNVSVDVSAIPTGNVDVGAP